MVKTTAAYCKLASILGSRIINRSKTLRVVGNPVKVFSQTLLIIPKAVTASISLPADVELYVDKKSKEEFVAFIISETTPRNKVRAPEPPPNSMMGIRRIVGQGIWHKDHGLGVRQGPKVLSEQERDILTQARVRIVKVALYSTFRYNDVISQLDLVNENARLFKIYMMLRDEGTSTRFMNFLEVVPATEQDSTRLLCFTGGKSYVPLTPEDESGNCIAFVPNSQDDSSIHSTIPLNPSTLAKPAGKTLNLNQKLQSELEKEFDEKFRQASE
jgi:hypothetical protein